LSIRVDTMVTLRDIPFAPLQKGPPKVKVSWTIQVCRTFASDEFVLACEQEFKEKYDAEIRFEFTLLHETDFRYDEHKPVIAKITVTCSEMNQYYPSIWFKAFVEQQQQHIQ